MADACKASAVATCATMLGLTWTWSSFVFGQIAAVEGIYDARAGQVSDMTAVWLLAVLAVAVLWVLRRAGHRSVLAGVGGLSLGTCISGGGLLLLAMLPAVVVTPPAAWLIMTLAGALVGVWSSKAAGNGPDAAAVPDA